jgi:hypothetical protein
VAVIIRAITFAVGCSAAAVGCASFVVAHDSNLVVTGHVYDDPTQSGRVSLDAEDVPPVQVGAPVPGCDVQVGRRSGAAGGGTAVAGADRSDTDGGFSVYGGRQPGPYEMTLTVECPGYAAVEHVFLHRGPRSYRAAVFVGRTR